MYWTPDVTTTTPLTTIEASYYSPQLTNNNNCGSIHKNISNENKLDLFEKSKILAKMYNGECISN